MSVLKIKDKDGNWVGIPTIKGEDGKDGEKAYDSAKKGGYTGTEEEFNADLANVKSIKGLSTAQGVILDKLTEHEEAENPHNVTAEQIGAVSKSGDTVNGNLDINGAFAVKRSDTNRKARTVAHNNADKEVDFQNYGDDSNYVSIRVATEAKGIGDAVNVTQMKDGQFSSFPVLHVGNKEKIFTFGTEELEAGTSPLGTGQLHFVYE